MKKFIPFVFLLNPITAGADPVNVVAEAFCECNRPVHKVAVEAMEAFSDGETVLVVEKNEELALLSETAEKCRVVLRNRYSDRSEEFAIQVNMEIERRCPEPRWGDGMPTMGGVGPANGGQRQEGLDEFLHSQGAPPKN